MNSNLNKFDFDFGIGSNNRSSKPLNEQKNKSTSNSYSYSSSTTSFSAAKSTPAWQPNKPSWTHQPAPSQPGLTRTEFGGGASMVGDIKGKSWNSMAPAVPPPKVAVASSVGIANKNPNLFGDLVSSAIGQNKSSSNAPLKSTAPVKSSFSMGGVANSLPKTSGASGYGNVGSSTTNNVGNSSGYGNMGGSMKNGGSASGYGNVSGSSMNNGGNASWGFNQSSVDKGSGFGGSTMPSGGVGGGMNSNKDPFDSLNFSSKPMRSSVGGGGGGGIGSMGKGAAMPTQNFDFGDFEMASKSTPSVFSSGSENPLGSNAGGQETSGGNDWEFDSGFGGHGDESTTELDGLPPPPAGISASTAKSKGLDNYKQGQYADAIKWLSWADVLLEKAGDGTGTMEVLSCRASCYKEVGEYKKAVADCTKVELVKWVSLCTTTVPQYESICDMKGTQSQGVTDGLLIVLDQDGKNVTVLVQRALLYESMEKYRLGADDLRTVMKLDPGNRVARSTIHRLNKMAEC